MFCIHKRWINGVYAGRWFRIWESADGADCAAYLQSATETDKQDGTVEYKMTWETK